MHENLIHTGNNVNRIKQLRSERLCRDCVTVRDKIAHAIFAFVSIFNYI